MKKILVTSNKGGVGKTTTTINFGDHLESLGFKVAYATSDPNQSLMYKKNCILLKDITCLKSTRGLDCDYLLIDSSPDFTNAVNVRLLTFVDLILVVVKIDEFTTQQFYNFYTELLIEDDIRPKLLGVLPNAYKHRKSFLPFLEEFQKFSVEFGFKLFSSIPDLIQVHESILLGIKYFEYKPDENKALPYLETSMDEICERIQIQS